MHLDSNLRLEIISSLLGQTIKPYDKKGRQTTDDILSVDDFHLHNLTGKRQAYQRKPVINVEDFFDPDYDCDFTHLADSTECTRGDELYERPTGWYRMALRVEGKYPDGDTWLGTKGWRSHSVPGEWPVSYHGTSLKGAKGIIRSHYKAGDRAVFGRGIYSTPDINVAEREEYAQTFKSKTTGKSYKVILQNRINPQKREVCSRFDYWLIRVDEETSTGEEKKIVESSIRPYGILIKELKDDEDDEDDGDASDGQGSDDDDICDDGYSNDSRDDSDYSVSNNECDDSGVHNSYDDGGDDNGDDDDDDGRDDSDDADEDEGGEDESGNENIDIDHFDADSTDHDGQYDEDTVEDCGDYDDDVGDAYDVGDDNDDDDVGDGDGDKDGDSHDSESEDDDNQIDDSCYDDHDDDDNGEDGDYDDGDDAEGVSDEDEGSDDCDNGEGDDYDDYNDDEGVNDEDDGSEYYDDVDCYDDGGGGDDWS